MSVTECRTRNRERARGSSRSLLLFRSLGIFVFPTMPQFSKLYKWVPSYRRLWKCEWIVFVRNCSVARVLTREVELVSEWTGLPESKVQSTLCSPADWILRYIKTIFFGSNLILLLSSSRRFVIAETLQEWGRQCQDWRGVRHLFRRQDYRPSAWRLHRVLRAQGSGTETRLGQRLLTTKSVMMITAIFWVYVWKCVQACVFRHAERTLCGLNDLTRALSFEHFHHCFRIIFRIHTGASILCTVDKIKPVKVTILTYIRLMYLIINLWWE